MRFRYIDDKGREVDLQTVEALAARISLGAVREDMPLYDAVADRWAPAGEHQIFWQIKEESGEGLGAAASPLLGAVEPDRSALAVDPPEIRLEGGSDGEESEEKAQEEADGEEGEAELTLEEAEALLEADLARAEDTFGLTLVDPDAQDHEAGEGEEDPEGEAEEPDLGLGLGDLELALEGEDEDPSPEDDGTGAFEVERATDLGGGQHLSDAWEGLDEEADAVDGLIGAGDYRLDQFPEDGTPTPPPPPDPDGDGGAREIAVTSFMDGPPEDLEIQRETAVEARKAAARARAEERRGHQGTVASEQMAARAPQGSSLKLFGIVAAVAAVAAVLTVGVITLTDRSGPREEPVAPVASAPEPTRPPPPDLDPETAGELAGAVNAAGLAALALLDSLSEAQGVAAGPATEWLQGRYLANASEFPQVPDFWNAYRTFVDRARQEVPLRYETTLLEDLTSEVRTEEEARRLAEEAGFWTLPTLWELQDLTRQLGELARNAVELHAYLESVEDRIRYDPIGSSVPADPVVEAIPLDEEVEEEMWDRIGRVADAFKEGNDLQEALPLRIGARADSIRAGSGAEGTP